MLCKAGGVRAFAKVGIVTSHINYDKPHVLVDGLYNEQKIKTCLYCGIRLEENRNVALPEDCSSQG